MKSEHDKFPEEFSVAELLEPQEATVALFQEVCIQLDQISVIRRVSLDDPDNEISEQLITYSLDKEFKNGSEIFSSSTHCTDERLLEVYAETMPTRSISLVTKEGVRYEYGERDCGKTRLWVRRPGERVMREEAPVDSIDIDNGNATSVHVSGTPDLMRMMASYIAEEREVRQKGLDRPTDGSMKEFTQAIQLALNSGVV